MARPSRKPTDIALVAPRTAMQQVYVGGAPELMPDQFEMYTGIAAWFHRARQFQQYQSAEAIFTAMMTLRDMGISPLAGLTHGYQTPGGKLDFETKVKLAVVQGRCPTFEYETLEWDDKVCRLRGRLDTNKPWKEASFTIEQARNAGLVKEKSAWMTYPKDQLLWKALIRLLRQIAGPLLLGMALPSAIARELEEPEEVEVLESKPLNVVAGAGRSQDEPQPRHDAGAPATEVVAPPKEDSRKEFLRIAKSQGKKSKDDIVGLVNLLMKEDLGLAATVVKESDLAASDWDGLLFAVRKRGWDKSAPRAGEMVVVSETVGPERQEGFLPEAEAPAAKPGPAPPPPTSEAGPARKDPLIEQLERWQSGDPEALVDYGLHAAKVYAAKGRTRHFVRETDAGAGVWWFTDQAILLACGSKHNADDGAPVADSALLLVGDHDQWKDSIASEGLRIMFARGIQGALADLEGGGR